VFMGSLNGSETEAHRVKRPVIVIYAKLQVIFKNFAEYPSSLVHVRTDALSFGPASYTGRQFLFCYIRVVSQPILGCASLFLPRKNTAASGGISSPFNRPL